MAVGNPYAPTARSIAEEALRRVGVSHPRSEEIARAEQQWVPEVINDIWSTAGINGNRRLKSLEREAWISLKAGAPRYDLPDDFDEELSVTLYKPLEVTLINTAGGSQWFEVVTANVDYFATQSSVIGKTVVTLDSGLESIIQVRNIDAVQPGSVSILSKVVVNEAWDSGSEPDFGQVAVVYETAYDIYEDGVREMDRYTRRQGVGTPTSFMKYREQFTLDVAPSDPYWALRLRYFCNPALLPDQDEILLKIYRDWNRALTLGVSQIGAASYGDLDLHKLLVPQYSAAVENVLRHEIPYGGHDVRFTLDDRGLDRSGY